VKEIDIDFPGLCPLDISDEDVLDAMKSISGYLDITPGDFKEIYRVAFKHAVVRLMSSTKAKDIMTRDVVYVSRQSPLIEAVDKMAKNDISGLPVVDTDGKVVGVISEKDIISHMGSKDARSFMEVVAHCLQNKGCVAITVREKSAEDIMTTPAITVSEDTTVTKIAGILREKSINRVPVANFDGRIVGIVSRMDIVGASCGRTS
jgi:CBS domain-containing protein